MSRVMYQRYPLLVGLLLGLLQTGLFFQLSFTLSSGFSTYLMITLCWLAGSAAGVLYVQRAGLPLAVFLAVTLLAYAACGALLALLPFDTRIWPLYALLVTVAGLYPGVFFARMSGLYTARSLFLRENNGFILGLVGGTLLFLLVGRVALWAAPLGVALLLYVWGEPRAESPPA